MPSITCAWTTHFPSNLSLTRSNFSYRYGTLIVFANYLIESRERSDGSTPFPPFQHISLYDINAPVHADYMRLFLDLIRSKTRQPIKVDLIRCMGSFGQAAIAAQLNSPAEGKHVQYLPTGKSCPQLEWIYEFAATDGNGIIRPEDEVDNADA